MGCDIHSHVEVRKDGQWSIAGPIFPLEGFDLKWSLEHGGGTHGVEPFGHRNYGWFGFLANVRNYSHTPCIQEPRGLPMELAQEVKEDSDGWGGDGHSHSWLTLRELLDYDYDQVFWDRRVTKQTAPNCWNGAALANEGEGRKLPLRDFLGEGFFAYLKHMKILGDPDDVRVVFWFDN